jgi:hypothetical protein
MRYPMSEKNQHNFQHFLGISAVFVMLTALLVSAGCLSPASENPPATVQSTCSVDAGVCKVPIPGSVRIEAAPQTYSPLMSSTPGIELTPNVSGFNPSDAEFTWNASYGQFLDWSSPNYTVSRLAQPVVNHGEKVYWTFMDVPALTRDPVIISVTARDLPSGQILGSSRLTLGWEGNFTVTVQKIE